MDLVSMIQETVGKGIGQVHRTYWGCHAQNKCTGKSVRPHSSTQERLFLAGLAGLLVIEGMGGTGCPAAWQGA